MLWAHFDSWRLCSQVCLRHKLNKRKNLLKKNRIQPNVLLHKRIRLLDKEIRNYYYDSRRKLIRNKIIPGDNCSLWAAVKTAKNQSSNSIPNVMTLNNDEIAEHEVSNAFASFFQQKIVTLKQGISISNTVHNGLRKSFIHSSKVSWDFLYL